MVNGGGTSLKFFADSPQLVDELGGMTDFLVGFVDFPESGYQFFGQILSAVGTEKPLLCVFHPSLPCPISGQFPFSYIIKKSLLCMCITRIQLQPPCFLISGENANTFPVM
jgi:hypothetical protein